MRIHLGLLLALLLLLSACKRNPIGGKCSAAMDCAKGAERCFKMAGETEGVDDTRTFKEKWCLPAGGAAAAPAE